MKKHFKLTQNTMFAYFIAGAISGICLASFFLGNELYRISKRNFIQKNEIERLMMLYSKIKASRGREQHKVS
ncbi:hypothetical protein [Pedobacter sp. N23S346]|uniref:hypothetical protein n=1 Tax=Pedobacter sp. N23S346 TaxID=3402750 RepID=UPI003ABE099A